MYEMFEFLAFLGERLIHKLHANVLNPTPDDMAVSPGFDSDCIKLDRAEFLNN